MSLGLRLGPPCCCCLRAVLWRWWCRLPIGPPRTQQGAGEWCRGGLCCAQMLVLMVVVPSRWWWWWRCCCCTPSSSPGGGVRVMMRN